MKLNKKISGVLSAILTLSTLFSAAGCFKEEENAQELDANVKRLVYTNGVHDYTAPYTDKDFIKDGKCDYTLVIPEASSSYIRKAMQEFCYFFKKATGFDMKTSSDAGLGGHSSNTKYISLGETTLLKSTDIDYSYEMLNVDGGRIVTKDSNVYIIGGFDTGTMHATYTFLKITFGLEVYTQNCYVINENVKNLKLRDYNVIDIPDFKNRTPSAATVQDAKYTEYDDRMYMTRMGYNDWVGQNRFRLHNVSDKYDENGNWIEGEYVVSETRYGLGSCTDTIINKAEMQGNHPKWFSTTGNQWCYTARGDEEEYEKFTDCVLECIKFALIFYKDADMRKNTMSFTAEDNDFVCGCDACSAEKSKYGVDSAALIKFFNRVLEKLDIWLDEGDNRTLYGREGFNIEIFAYGWSEDPPVKKNASGEWEAIDDSIRPRKDLTISVAPIFVDYQKSIYDDANRWIRDKLDGWKAIAPSVVWYGYSINRSAWLYPYDSFNYWTSDGVQYWAAISDSAILVEVGQYEIESAWHDLKTWLIAKLSWDCTLDQTELINDYFENVYGPGAQAMKNFFNAERIYCDREYSRTGMYKKHSIYNYVDAQCEWDYNQVSGWIAMCDKALEAIEPYKTTMPEKYAIWAENIEKEAISPIGILLEQHVENMNQAQKDGLLNRLRNDVKVYKFEKLACAHQAYVGAVYLPDYIEGFVK